MAPNPTRLFGEELIDEAQRLADTHGVTAELVEILRAKARAAEERERAERVKAAAAAVAAASRRQEAGSRGREA